MRIAAIFAFVSLVSISCQKLDGERPKVESFAINQIDKQFLGGEEYVFDLETVGSFEVDIFFNDNSDLDQGNVTFSYGFHGMDWVAKERSQYYSNTFPVEGTHHSKKETVFLQQGALAGPYKMAGYCVDKGENRSTTSYLNVILTNNIMPNLTVRIAQPNQDGRVVATSREDFVTFEGTVQAQDEMGLESIDVYIITPDGFLLFETRELLNDQMSYDLKDLTPVHIQNFYVPGWYKLAVVANGGNEHAAIKTFDLHISK